MDCYRDMEDVEQTFLQFMDAVPFYGMVVACNDNDDLRRLLHGREAQNRYLRTARGFRLPHLAPAMRTQARKRQP